MTPVRTVNLPLPEPEIKEIRRYAQCPAGADEELRQCAAEMASLSGRVCYCECDVRRAGKNLDLEFTKTDSENLKNNLHGCEKIILFAATVGLLPDRLLAKYTKTSPAKTLLVQAAGAERIEAVCNEFCGCMEREYQKQDCFLHKRFSPGYGDLPLAIQKDIFAVLDCPGKIGLTLSGSLLMMPSKSVTAIIGIEKNKKREIIL